MCFTIINTDRVNPLTATVTQWQPVIVCFNIISTERVKFNPDIWGKKHDWEDNWGEKFFLMGGVGDGWAARDEQPTHLPPHPSLHQEMIGIQRA
jgi:hypothetical protein